MPSQPVTRTCFRALSGNALKLIAALSMTIDHAGLLLWPQAILPRILGRLAFPIFAFMIAEGCRYTKNRLRYFLTIAALAVGCQVVYYLFDRTLYMSILVTFSLSILAIYALQLVQRLMKDPQSRILHCVAAQCLLAFTVAGIWMLTRVVQIDYGFWGCMTPVLVSLFQTPAGEPPVSVGVQTACLALGLTALGLVYGSIQWCGLAACPLLLCYSGLRGRWRMKYFFYIFYPAHLAVLQGIAMLLG